MDLPATTDQVDSAGTILNDRSQTLATRFRALFILRNLKDDRSVEWIAKAFGDSSALLKHELAYCLGQMQNPSAIPHLIAVLEDVEQEPMVRHEAGEALGAVGNPSVIGVLSKYAQDSILEVAETCQLALQRIQWVKAAKRGDQDSRIETIYNSVDPAPAACNQNVEDLAALLIDENNTLWNRYRAMFALRNMNTPKSIKAIAQGLYCKDSALFRHEIAYVLGQIQSPLVIPELSYGLKRAEESGMVRHECAEALGSIATPECRKLLEEYSHDKERVVRESCEVAIDMADYEQNREGFQYAHLN
jgi:deoxyhypusine monooxygenase